MRVLQFLDTCREVTVLLGSGDVITCSRTRHADLFHGGARGAGGRGGRAADGK